MAIYTRTTTVLESRHPTDSHWWGMLNLDPAGKTKVHVRASGPWGREGEMHTVSLPFVELDELQELIHQAREQCARAGFID